MPDPEVVEQPTGDDSGEEIVADAFPTGGCIKLMATINAKFGVELAAIRALPSAQTVELRHKVEAELKKNAARTTKLAEKVDEAHAQMERVCVSR